MARVSVEVLIPEKRTQTASALLQAMFSAIIASGDEAVATTEYRGGCEWLLMWGVGQEPRSDWRHAHIARGGKVSLWDLGYFGRRRKDYARTSINDDHPQAWLDRTIPDSSRWDAHGVGLREDFDPNGPIVLVGLGRKQRAYTGASNWEAQTLKELRRRFPDKEIVYRPKPSNPALQLGIRTDVERPIDAVLRGASLVVCRQSNVAIDATVAGVPFEADDGAAMWLSGKPYTRENRRDFLHRLMWWQWRAEEAPLAWWFLKGIAEIECA